MVNQKIYGWRWRTVGPFKRYLSIFVIIIITDIYVALMCHLHSQGTMAINSLHSHCSAMGCYPADGEAEARQLHTAATGLVEPGVRPGSLAEA